VGTAHGRLATDRLAGNRTPPSLREQLLTSHPNFRKLHVQALRLVHVKNAAVPPRTAAFVFPASDFWLVVDVAKSCVALNSLFGESGPHQSQSPWGTASWSVQEADSCPRPYVERSLPVHCAFTFAHSTNCCIHFSTSVRKKRRRRPTRNDGGIAIPALSLFLAVSSVMCKSWLTSFMVMVSISFPFSQILGGGLLLN
jgi:hypothetical protein